MSKIGKSLETESRLMTARSWGKQEQRVAANGCMVSFRNNQNVLKLVVIVAQLCECTEATVL